MKGVLKRLKSKFARQSAVIDSNEPQSPGQPESHEPGKDVPMPDIYGCDDTVTQPMLEISIELKDK